MTRNAHKSEELMTLAARAFVDHPYENLSLQGVADSSGASLWALRYHFGNIERLFRAVARRLIDDVAERTQHRPAPGARVMDVIAGYAGFLANLFEDEAYRSLLYFVLRNGRSHPWLERAYDERVVTRFATALEPLVLDAGRTHGTPILLTKGAARRLFKRLETELALAALLPCQTDAPIDREETIRAVVCEAFAATYVFDWRVSNAA